LNYYIKTCVYESRVASTCLKTVDFDIDKPPSKYSVFGQMSNVTGCFHVDASKNQFFPILFRSVRVNRGFRYSTHHFCTLLSKSKFTSRRRGSNAFDNDIPRSPVILVYLLALQSTLVASLIGHFGGTGRSPLSACISYPSNRPIHVYHVWHYTRNAAFNIQILRYYLHQPARPPDRHLWR